MQTRLFHKGFGMIVGLFLASVLSLPLLLVAESKPVLTISTTNPETLYKIAERIATLTGTLEDFLDATGPYKELKGIHAKNPIVFVLHAEGSEFKDPLLFLPIAELEKVEIPGFDMLLAQSKKQSDGKYLLSSQIGAFTMTPKPGYLVLSSESSDREVPDDPSMFIKGMETFSLGIRFDVENTTAEAIQMVLAPIQLIAGMQGGESVMRAFEQIDQAVELICKETRSLTYGITMDPRTADVNLRMSIVAKPGSVLEKQLAFLKDAKTAFGGFLGDANAVMSGAGVGKGFKDIPEQLELTASQIDQLIDGLLEQVEENAEEDEIIELAEAVAESARKLLLGTLMLDKIDYGISLGNDGTLALGTSIAESKELEKIGSLVMKHLAHLAPDKEQFENIVKNMKTNYATVDGFQLSSFVFPLKDIAADDDNFPSALANKTFHAYWGLKADAFVLLVGFDPKSEDRLKSAIAEMKNPVACPDVKFSLMQLGRLLKNFGVDQVAPEAATVVQALLDAGRDANVTISQTVSKDTQDVQFFISGRIWQAFAKIQAGTLSSLSGDQAVPRVRVFE